jgi:hypothetical protein
MAGFLLCQFYFNAPKRFATIWDTQAVIRVHEISRKLILIMKAEKLKVERSLKFKRKEPFMMGGGFLEENFDPHYFFFFLFLSLSIFVPITHTHTPQNL